MTIPALLLLTASFYLTAPAVALAIQSDSLEITGDGVTTPVTFTLAKLEAMEQYEHVYSTINTYPTKRWYTARGIKLRDLLTLAGMTEEAKLIKFISNDGYDVTLTVKELLEDKRYYFPGLKENHPSDGSIPGSPEGAQEVEPILALTSAEGSDNPANMNDRDFLLLMLGQRAVTEQTNNLFLKYTSRIEVLTTTPEKWDSPKTSIPDGTVLPPGIMLELSNKGNDDDKIYYTLDGSTPTVNSPMFNWSASRWWPLRANDLESVNRPIELTEDTVLKAITIGPGKEDSDVVTFTFTTDPTAVDPTKIPGGPPTGVTLDRNAIDLKVGATFQLQATIAPYNATDQSVTWSSSDTRVATVDNNGLVTVVGPGSAAITVKTFVGNYTSSCIVNGPEQDDDEEGAVIAGPVSPENEAQEDPVEPPVGEPSVEEPPVEEIQEEELSVEEPPLPEDDQQFLEEKVKADPATAPLKTSDEAPDSSGEPPVDELPVPDVKGQYLAEKDAVALASPAADVSSEQPGSLTRQIFEMSLDAAVPLPLQEVQNELNIYTAAIFLFLFLSGVSKKIVEYAKEL